jgi:hypothetical protein
MPLIKYVKLVRTGATEGEDCGCQGKVQQSFQRIHPDKSAGHDAMGWCFPPLRRYRRPIHISHPNQWWHHVDKLFLRQCGTIGVRHIPLIRMCTINCTENRALTFHQKMVGHSQWPLCRIRSCFLLLLEWLSLLPLQHLLLSRPVKFRNQDTCPTQIFVGFLSYVASYISQNEIHTSHTDRMDDVAWSYVILGVVTAVGGLVFLSLLKKWYPRRDAFLDPRSPLRMMRWLSETLDTEQNRAPSTRLGVTRYVRDGKTLMHLSAGKNLAPVPDTHVTYD